MARLLGRAVQEFRSSRSSGVQELQNEEHSAAVGALRPQMNFLTRLSLGLAIQIHGSETRG
jgi:hypothetical protein